MINARYHLTHKWDILLEGRYLTARQAGIDEVSFLGAADRHVGNNLKIGVGYTFGSVSDDLTCDDKGVFINMIARFREIFLRRIARRSSFDSRIFSGVVRENHMHALCMLCAWIVHRGRNSRAGVADFALRKA